MADEQFSKLSVIDKNMVNWKAKITVLIKKPFKHSTNSRRTKYQKLVLSDEWGNCVDAVMYDSVIDLYKDILQQDKAYIISNAMIDRANKDYSSTFAKTDYSWTITAKTTVMSVPYPAIVKSLFDGNFSYYSSFVVGQYINTVVVVISGKPPRHTRTGQTIHEYVCIDNEFNEIVISLWNDDGVTEQTHSLMVDTNPVVALINFKVNNYHGFSLNSNTKSFVVTKMDIPALLEMDKWRTEHMAEIQERSLREGEADHKINTALNINLPELKIAELMDAEMKRKYIITAHAKLEDLSPPLMYICCETCHTKSTVGFRNLYKCARCNDFKFAIRRYRFCVKVNDGSGEIDVTMFGKYGEEILNICEDECHHKYYPDWILPKEDINSSLEGKMWRMTILKNEYNRNGVMEVSYNVDNMIQVVDENSKQYSSKTRHECTISEMIQSNAEGSYALSVEAKFEEVPPSFMYVCCEKCHRRTDVTIKTPFQCSGKDCSGYQNAVRRYRFCIQIHDSTGKIMVTLNGKFGEIILDKSEDEFYTQYHLKWIVSSDDINKKLHGMQWKMTIVKKMLYGSKATSYIVEDITPLIGGESEPPATGVGTQEIDSSDLVQGGTTTNTVIPVRVKIEEEEDAKRNALAKQRRNVVRQSDDDIVSIDLEDNGHDELPNGKKNSRPRSHKRKTAG